MAQTYPLPSDDRRAGFRVISSEDAPGYDTGAQDQTPKRHVTMIEDDTVERVAAECGMAALGLYTMLERRVGKDGRWRCTMAELATAFGQSVRHVLATAAALEQGGFLERTQVLGARGATVGIEWYLPKHMRTYGVEVPHEPRGEPPHEVPHEPSRAGVVESSNYVVGTSNPSSLRSDGEKRPADLEQKPKAKRKTRMPADFGLSPDRLAYAVKAGMTEAEAAELLEDMRLWSHGKGGMYEEWDLAWQSWVRKHVREKRPTRAAPVNGQKPALPPMVERGKVKTAEQMMADYRQKFGGQS